MQVCSYSCRLRGLGLSPVAFFQRGVPPNINSGSGWITSVIKVLHAGQSLQLSVQFSWVLIKKRFIFCLEENASYCRHKRKSQKNILQVLKLDVPKSQKCIGFLKNIHKVVSTLFSQHNTRLAMQKKKKSFEIFTYLQYSYTTWNYLA